MKIGRCRLLESPYPARDEAFFILYAKCKGYNRTPTLTSIAKVGAAFWGSRLGSPSFFIIMAYFFAVTRGVKLWKNCVSGKNVVY